MNVFSRRLEPQPIELPQSKREVASQVTVVDLPRPVLPTYAYCGCGHVLEPGNRFCGGCGARTRYVWYVR